MSNQASPQELNIVPQSELLAKILDSDKFQLALSTGAQVAAKGYESGFRVYIDEGQQIFIPEVFQGSSGEIIHEAMDPLNTTNTVLIIDDDDRIDEDPLTGELIFVHIPDTLPKLIDLHFHPDTGIMPSPGDLQSYVRRNSFQHRTLNMIAGVDDSGDVNIFCLNKPSYPLVREDVEYYENQVLKGRHNIDFDYAQKILREIGVNTLLIRLKANKPGIRPLYKLSPEQLKLLTEFSGHIVIPQPKKVA